MYNLDDSLMPDAPIFVIEDDPSECIEQANTSVLPAWKVLIVDDDPEVHEATILACGSFEFEHRPLNLLSAYSGTEARTVLQDHPDVALLLLDVVMETSQAGLELVKYVRTTLNNQIIRIILRTGQPGEAPELDVIRDYDINDYRLKIDLTRQRLLTTVITTLRSYRDLVTLDATNKELDTLYSQQIVANQKIERQQQELIAQNQALTIAKQQAVKANQAKSVFLGNMSHELRTPLNAVLGYTQLLAREPQLQAFTKELETINRCGKHLLVLINDVLDLSRIDSGQVVLNIDTFSFHELLKTLKDIWTTKAQHKGLDYQLEWGSDLPHYVRTDEGKLRQVLMNLLSNAIKFTEQGHITFRIHQTAVEPSKLNEGPHLPLTPHYWLNFEVRDSGPGISAKELEHIFHPFIQGEQARSIVDEGTGLGLAISHQFVSLMGGNLSVTSSLGAGSCFKFSVPVEQAQACVKTPLVEKAKVTSLAPNQPTYRILVVDDQPDNCSFLTKLLGIVGFEAQAVYSGEAAVSKWLDWHPHLIWMDIRMDGQDGYETTEQIKADSSAPTPVIVALTAFAFEEDKEKALALGFDDFVRKPFQESEIFEKLATHLGIEYLYDGEGPPQPEVLSPLTSEQLEFIERDQLQHLYDAALSLDPNRTAHLLAELPTGHEGIRKQLLSLSDNFRFDIIIQLIEPLVGSSVQ